MTGREPGAGYSGTPLPRKLGIKAGSRVALIGAPPGFESTLGPTDAAEVARIGLHDSRSKTSSRDLVMYFVTSRVALARDWKALTTAVVPDGAVWVAWPKRSSGVETDLTEDVLREICLPSGMVDNKVCAIDQTWSGLRFVWRLEHRTKQKKS